MQPTPPQQQAQQQLPLYPQQQRPPMQYQQAQQHAMMQHIQQQQPRPQLPVLQAGQTLPGSTPGPSGQQQAPVLIKPAGAAKQPAAAMKSAELLPALKRQKKKKGPEKAASDRVRHHHLHCRSTHSVHTISRFLILGFYFSTKRPLHS